MIFINHRRVVIPRRVTFDRDRAKERAHILEGLKKALDNIDKVIETIKKSETKEIAKESLVKKFSFTEIQADAILQMRLQTLAGLERKKIEEELKEKLKFVAECEAILKDKKRIDAILKEELLSLKATYGDPRRTTVVKHPVGQFSAKDTIPNAPMIVALTTGGYVKRLSPMQFRAQNRGGKGVKGMTTKDDDEILSLLHVMNHDDLLFFTNTGRVFRLPAYELPQGTRIAKGQAIVNLLQLQPEEHITSILKANLEDKTHLFMVTRQGTVKRTELTQFENIRRSGLIAQRMPPGDELRWVVATSSKDEIILLSHKGKAIHFPEEDVRAMGRSAAGVRGIKLGAGDYVVEADAVNDVAKSKVLVVMENGLGKMTPLDQYRLQGRGGTGVKAAQLTAKTGDVIGGCVLKQGEDGDLLCISKQGQTIRMRLSDIPSLGRATQGVIIMRLRAADKVATMSVVMEDKEGEEAVQEAAVEVRGEEVEVILKEERRVKRAESMSKKVPVAVGTSKGTVAVAAKPARKPAVAHAPAAKPAPAQPALALSVEKPAPKKPAPKPAPKKVALKKPASKKAPAKKAAPKKPASAKATAGKKAPAKKPAPKKKAAAKKPAKKAAPKKKAPAKKKPAAKKKVLAKRKKK